MHEKARDDVFVIAGFFFGVSRLSPRVPGWGEAKKQAPTSMARWRLKNPRVGAASRVVAVLGISPLFSPYLPSAYRSI